MVITCLLTANKLCSLSCLLIITNEFCLQLYSTIGCMDEQLVTHVEQLLEELGDQPAATDDNQQAICSSNDEMELT